MVWEAIPMIAQAGQQAYAGHEGAKAIEQASKQELKFGRMGLGEQRRQFNLMNQLLSPFYESGARQLPSLQARAQARDFAELQQQPAIQQLIQENLQDARDKVYSGNLSRSGYGLRQLGASEADTLSAIENLLTNRQQSLSGQAQTTAGSLANLGQQNVNAMTQLLGGMGRTQSQGILGQQNVQAAAMGNLANLGAAAADYYRR